MPIDEELRRELLAMAEHAGDQPSAARLWEILDDYECWPGRRLVGDDGTRAAWQIAQLAVDDVGLQRRCLELLEVAVAAADAPPDHHACLLDRVLMADGRDQLYGSQFVVRDGRLEPWHIQEPEHVDLRRARVGLPPLAEQTRLMHQRFNH